MNTLVKTISNRLRLKPRHAPFAFHGGLTLAPNKRALRSNIIDLGVPPTLVLPLTSYTKQPVTPFVAAGDFVLRGQLLAPGIVAPASGMVRAIEDRQTIHPAGHMLIESIVLDSDDTDKRESASQSNDADHNLAELIAALNADNGDQASALLDQYALAGLGGAGFPTARKLLAAKNGLHTLIINAAECEPEIACDEALMQSEASDIAKGIAALVQLTRCTTCIVAIEDSKPTAIKSMQNELHDMDASIQLLVIPTRYPTGAESPLIECVTGQFIPHNEKPIDHGILCINIATAHALWHALNNKPLDSRIISLGGHSMPNPCNVRVRFGTLVEYILAKTNNDTVTSNNRIRAGGPLSGFDLNELAVPVTAKTNCILAEPVTTDSPAQPCIRCGQCADVCPSKLLPQQLHWYAMAGELNKCESLNLDACIECGCCDLVCPASIKLTEAFRYAKSQASFIEQQQRKAQDAQIRYTKREQREQQRKLDKAAAIEQRKQSIKKSDQTNAKQIAEALARARANRKPKHK